MATVEQMGLLKMPSVELNSLVGDFYSKKILYARGEKTTLFPSNWTRKEVLAKIFTELEKGILIWEKSSNKKMTVEISIKKIKVKVCYKPSTCEIETIFPYLNEFF